MKHDIWISIRLINTFWFGLAAIAGLILTPFQPVNAGTDSFETQITALLGSADTPVLAMVSGKTVYATPLIRQMYRHDGYHLIWKDTAITSFSAALEGLEADGLTPGDYRFAEIDPLLDASKRDRLTPDKRVEADILLTEAFLRAVYHLFFGKADPERIDADINFARTYADEDAMPVLMVPLLARQFQTARAPVSRDDLVAQGGMQPYTERVTRTYHAIVLLGLGRPQEARDELRAAGAAYAWRDGHPEQRYHDALRAAFAAELVESRRMDAGAAGALLEFLRELRRTGDERQQGPIRAREYEKAGRTHHRRFEWSIVCGVPKSRNHRGTDRLRREHARWCLRALPQK